MTLVMAISNSEGSRMTKFLLVLIPATLVVAIAVWLGSGVAAGMIGTAGLLALFPAKRR